MLLSETFPMIYLKCISFDELVCFIETINVDHTVMQWKVGENYILVEKRKNTFYRL